MFLMPEQVSIHGERLLGSKAALIHFSSKTSHAGDEKKRSPARIAAGALDEFIVRGDNAGPSANCTRATAPAFVAYVNKIAFFGDSEQLRASSRV
jgi:hypothetical protein